jgi:hypothetical protein
MEKIDFLTLDVNKLLNDFKEISNISIESNLY